ncbi:glycosyltransferase family 4 protein [Bacillus sp. 1P02SD]|uniref:glycosyltransferase family 4 protein n=1 Tax=Bacillus sp. 1P02SD TaxID=3132264 RepID=UPI0039A37DE2
MDIYYLSNSSIPSRTANSVHVMKMCQAFFSSGHNVTLFAQEKNDNNDIYEYYGITYKFDLITISRPNIRGIGSFMYARTVRKVIKNKKLPDVFYGRDIYSLRKISGLDKPFIYEAHSIPSTFFHKRMEKRLFKNRNFARLVVISEALKSEYLKQFDTLKQEDIIVAPDGADLPQKSVAIDEVEISSEKDNNLNVGYVGHLYSGRGIELIIELASRIKNLNFHIIGGMDKDIIYWKNKCKHLRNIKFYGFIPNGKLNEYYSKFDIMLAPYQDKVRVAGDKGDTSRWMSPMKIFEYMAYSKAIISSDLPVLREVLKSEYNCILCSHTDVESWEKALLMLSKNEDFRQRLGQNAFKCLSKNYTWNKRVDVVLSNLNADI